uniref:Uncharacterized protein n=1 Tax=Arundo donax TaxID=35708 RepID=A0A0A9G7P4_ARUDO
MLVLSLLAICNLVCDS